MTQVDLLFFCIVKGAQDSGQASNIWFTDGHIEIKKSRYEEDLVLFRNNTDGLGRE